MSDRRKTSRPHTPERRKKARRSSQRWPAQFEVRYGIGKELLSGQGVEIGEAGLAYTADKLYPPGTELNLRYRLHPEDDWVRIKGVVRHIEAHILVGAELLDLRTADRLQIVDFVSGKNT